MLLIMPFAMSSAEDALLLPAAAGMFAAGYSDLIFFLFFNWIAKSSVKLWASFHPFMCQPSHMKQPGCASGTVAGTASCRYS